MSARRSRDQELWRRSTGWARLGIYVLIDDGPPEHWSYEFVREGVRS